MIVAHVLFPITYECNLSCKSCPVRKREKISLQEAVRKLTTLAGKVEWVYITGGEPFLVDNLPEVCEELGRSFKVGVTTNGTIHRPEVADVVDRIGISIDGERDYHDAYRGKGVFDKALNLFKAIKGRCETVIMSVAFKDNIQSLIGLRPLIEEMDPDYWQIQRDINDPSIVLSVL
jgi:MoaA/NifB/PqqE/SkfB family radical SAM enzyme